MLDSSPLIPPMPPLLSEHAGGLRVLASLRRNGYSAFPQRCFTQPVVSLRALGRPLVLAAGPESMQAILTSDAGHYRRMRVGQRVLSPIVGRGLLVSEGDTWRRQRRAMAPAFTPRTVPVLAGHIAACAERGCRNLETSGPVDLFSTMRRLALDVAAVSMFSLEIGAFDQPLRNAVTRFMTGIGTPRPSDFLLPPGTPTLLGWRRARFRRQWVALIGRIIAARHAQAPTDAPRDLFDLMQTAFGDQGGGATSELIDEVATMIVAGHETTASVLFWSCLLLAQSPRWQNEIAQEVRDKDLTPDGAAFSLPSLHVTTAVVRETLRLYPPAFMSGRETVGETDLCGHALPDNAMVLLPFWMLHRNPALWHAPAQFDPRRFLDRPDPPRFSFLPFGAGPHVCIGAQLAMTEAVLVLARLLQDFALTLADHRPVLPVGVLSTRPSHAPAFHLRRR
ncbi:cytochrome P450 [Gluconacetobacter sp. 1c LMG 22058]|uniref:Cytochrome P450 n=1 Tax=Gluconacetobacter dulcium TaxID=2729096 RepID=A0A7W4K2J4_9PROT|nr:cytochrome P450 [Gluconacetobacter dulcium]MBB2199214.1 cytochrome P450 [Gluconacetobacter dulcium]